MAKCVQCSAETHLYAGGVPICLSCTAVREKNQQPALKPKPPQSERSLGSINAMLTVTRAEYRHALAMQMETERLKDAFGPDSPDDKHAPRNANEELSIAAARYEDALREFIAFTDPQRRAG